MKGILNLEICKIWEVCPGWSAPSGQSDRQESGLQRPGATLKIGLAMQSCLGATEAGWAIEIGDACILKFSSQNNPSFPVSEGLPQNSPSLPLRMRLWSKKDVPNPFCTLSPTFAYLNPLQRGPLTGPSGGPPGGKD